MDEYVIKQKIQMACVEPRAPEKLIQQVILRAKAVVMGVAAQKQLETATAENVSGLVSRVLVGQLAAAEHRTDFGSRTGRDRNFYHQKSRPFHELTKN